MHKEKSDSSLGDEETFIQNFISDNRAVVKQVTDLDVSGKLPSEAEIEAMVKQLRDGIDALNLDVSFIDENNNAILQRTMYPDCFFSSSRLLPNWTQQFLSQSLSLMQVRKLRCLLIVGPPERQPQIFELPTRS